MTPLRIIFCSPSAKPCFVTGLKKQIHAIRTKTKRKKRLFFIVAPPLLINKFNKIFLYRKH
jgi:hypothetical protein